MQACSCSNTCYRHAQLLLEGRPSVPGSNHFQCDTIRLEASASAPAVHGMHASVFPCDPNSRDTAGSRVQGAHRTTSGAWPQPQILHDQQGEAPRTRNSLVELCSQVLKAVKLDGLRQCRTGVDDRLQHEQPRRLEVIGHALHGLTSGVPGAKRGALQKRRCTAQQQSSSQRRAGHAYWVIGLDPIAHLQTIGTNCRMADTPKLQGDPAMR